MPYKRLLLQKCNMFADLAFVLKVSKEFSMICLHVYFVFRSVFLGNIKEAFDKNPDLKNLLLDDFFKSAVHKCQVGPLFRSHTSLR